MSSENLGEFMSFFPIGLNPFKIQTKFKLEWSPTPLIQNPEGSGR
jgi:hypothetical protein